MVREFKNDNGITYEIVAENKELDRTLLCNWTDDGHPRYIVAWGIDYQRHYWAQGHYFLEDFKETGNIGLINVCYMGHIVPTLGCHICDNLSLNSEMRCF